MKPLTKEEREEIERYPAFDWNLYDLMEEKNETSCIGCFAYNGNFKVQYCIPALCATHYALWLADPKRFEREYWDKEWGKEHNNE